MMTDDTRRLHNRWFIYLRCSSGSLGLLLSDFSLFELIQPPLLFLCFDPLGSLFQLNLPLSIRSFLYFLHPLLLSEVLLSLLLLSLTLCNLLLQLLTNHLLFRSSRGLRLLFFSLIICCLLGLCRLMILLNCLRGVIKWRGILWD